MSNVAIRVENLGKRYRIGLEEERPDTLVTAVTRLLKAPMESYRNLRKLSHFESDDAEDIIWALRDVNFEVQEGEVIGVIGSNGAGKSTLLKILSRITEPTTGRVELRGRVSCLLEVGTGFHPELTGRENVYLNGTILGMTRAEVDRKFDEIVEFSGVGKFIDTPVKRFSSGMKVRLAFAVAAHLEPEILVVDEVLAVGDAAFQKKCLGKMNDVVGEGRTVVFVSHDMAAIEQLCERVLLLEEGRLTVDDSAAVSITEYLKGVNRESGWDAPFFVRKDKLNGACDNGARISDIQLLDADDKPLSTLRTGDSLLIKVAYECWTKVGTPAFVVSLRSDIGQEIARWSTSPISGYPIKELGSKGTVQLRIPYLPLTAGRYTLSVSLVEERIGALVDLKEVVIFDVGPRDVYNSGLALDRSRGLIVMDHEWVHEKEESDANPQHVEREFHP